MVKKPAAKPAPKKTPPKHPVSGQFMAQHQVDEIARRARMGDHVAQVQLRAIQARGKADVPRS